jgi:iron complex transport system substrate-binding protein
VGRSHECDYPEHFVADVPVLTSQKTQFDASAANPAKDIDDQVRLALSSGSSLYTLDVDLLQKLQPDVILTQSLCEVCSIDLVTVERVAKRMAMPAKIIDLNPHTLQEVLDDVCRVGESVGCETGAKWVMEELNARVEAVRIRSLAISRRPRVAFFEWTDPIYVGGHWTPEIIEMAGGLHPLNAAGSKSVAVKDEIIAALDPDLLIIAPCGMNLEKTCGLVRQIRNDETRRQWFNNLRAVQAHRVALVDGNEMFNRPGPRLVDALEFCSDLVQGYAGGADSVRKEQVKAPGFPWQPL